MIFMSLFVYFSKTPEFCLAVLGNLQANVMAVNAVWLKGTSEFNPHRQINQTEEGDFSSAESSLL